jgi:GH43 family beta-xylosidase
MLAIHNNRKSGVISLCFVVLLLLNTSTFLQAQNFKPLLRNSGPDPFMTFYNGHYYLTYTIGPNIKIVKAASVKDLPAAAEVQVWSDNTPGRCCNMWAPELFYLNKPDGVPGEKRWYLYYCADDGNIPNHRNHVLESSGSDPLGPYNYKAQLTASNTVNKFAIDPSILQHDNGQLYLLWSGSNSSSVAQQILIAPLSNPWTISGSAVSISSPALSWEKNGGDVNEAPNAIKRNGKTFIVYSASNCSTPDYALGMLTNTNGNYTNTSSWSKSGTPVFSKVPEDGVYAPGSHAFFKSPDGSEDWMVYHATVNPAGVCDQNRNPRIQRIYWNSDNTIIFPRPASTNADLHFPSGDGGGASGQYNVVAGATYKLTHKGTAMCLEVAGNSSAAGANVQQWNDNGNDAQRWIVSREADNAYKLIHKGTTMGLDVENGSSAQGSNVRQWNDNNADAQRWYITHTPDYYFKLMHKGTNQCLDVNANSNAAGANVQQWTDNGNDAQRWRMDIMEYPVISGAAYRLTHKGTNQCLDVESGSTVQGTNVRQWTDNGATAQQWVVTLQPDGFYKLTHRETNQCLEVNGNSTADGANVQQWTDNGNDAQRWKMEHTGNGYFKLTHKGTTKCLDVAGNRSTNGANVMQYADNGGDAQRWRLDLVEKPASLAAKKSGAITEIINSNDAEKFFIYPVPATNTLFINYYTDKNLQTKLMVVNTMGQLIKQQTINLNKGLNKVEFDISLLGAGSYIVRFVTNQTTIVRKVEVIK